MSETGARMRPAHKKLAAGFGAVAVIAGGIAIGVTAQARAEEDKYTRLLSNLTAHGSNPLQIRTEEFMEHSDVVCGHWYVAGGDWDKFFTYMRMSRTPAVAVYGTKFACPEVFAALDNPPS